MANTQDSPSSTLRPARGTNFEDDECVRLCRAWLSVSQNPSKGSGQKRDQFWTRVAKLFEDSCPPGSIQRPQRSLESKWGTINHDVAKFASAYASVCDLNESGSSEDDKIEKSKVFYQQTSQGNKPFMYMECWRTLRNAPKWMSYRAHGVKSTPDKRHIEEIAFGDSGVGEVQIGGGSVTSPVRPIGNKKSKKLVSVDLRSKKLQADFAKVTEAMVATNKEKVEVLKEAANLQLFLTPLTGLDADAVRYIKLRRAQVLQSLEASMPQVERVIRIGEGSETPIQDLNTQPCSEFEMDEYASLFGV